MEKKLVFTDEIILRSLYKAFLDALVQYGYHPDTGEFGDTQVDVKLYDEAIKNIQSEKGFNIDLFSESSARNKGKKQAPRIVIVLEWVFQGDIGAPSISYTEGTTPGTYKAIGLPPKAANLVVCIYLVSSNSKQHYVLNAIKDNVLGQQSFIKRYDKPDSQPFLITHTSFYDNDDPMEGIIERGYVYTIPDIFLADNTTHKDNISPIKEINVDIEKPNDGFQVK